MKTIREEGREVSVRAEVDVLVAGGGLGGVSAAMAAARAGAKTLLVERNSFLGGVATAGMCCSMFNAFYTASGKLGTTGNALEAADALAEAAGYGGRWKRHKAHIIYDVEEAKLILHRLVCGAGAQILYESVISSAIVEDGRLRGIIVESKGGREAILAKVTVDATGDADVAALSGARLRTESPRPLHSFVFRVGGVDVDRFVGYFRENPEQYPAYMDIDWSFDEAMDHYRDTGSFLFPHGGGMQMDVFREAMERGELPERIGTQDTLDACQMHALRDRGVVHVITGFTHFDGLDVGDISTSIADGREMAFAVTRFFRDNLPGFERSFVIATADDLGIRASRWIDGEFRFTGEMYDSPSHFPDAVGRSVPLRGVVKHKGERAWSAQEMLDFTFDVPYRCLVPAGVDGLLMGAGRSISIDNPWRLRLMVYTMVIGQGAGVGAAIAAAGGGRVAEADTEAMRTELTRQGVDLT